ncbi:MAG: hypothetical protein M0C28_40330 [Candidatus Moduliflexus flocculans]|nr:hypothetical protein [Candidatus Moduliflexus flocculans]
MIARYKHTLKDDAFIGAFYTGRRVRPGLQPASPADRRPVPPEPDRRSTSFHLFGSLDQGPGRRSDRHRPRPRRSTTTTPTATSMSTSATRTSPRASGPTPGFLTRTGLRRP